ncbi:MAG: Mut7-C RNAse domain-containing protein [Chloroflexi bacterium]|nr:Mut7-C RNAse domain-containing protein [Chloroflexota bacterium]
MAPEDRTRFIADVNVGRLARWLRALGYDTLFFKEIDDDDLVRIGLAEGRVVLTRDSRLMERRVAALGPLKAILIRSEEVQLQLKQVVESLGLDCRRRPFSLCLECNQGLESVPRSEVRTQVPPYVFETQASFHRCPSCRKVYWQGTHWRRMSEELERACLVEMAE